jgi:hypothetical protein
LAEAARQDFEHVVAVDLVVVQAAVEISEFDLEIAQRGHNEILPCPVHVAQGPQPPSEKHPRVGYGLSL